MKFPTDIPTAALLYAEQFGLKVFPVPPGTKQSYKSMHLNGGERWGATNDVDVIRRDFQKKWRNANVGIVTGPENGIFVIDADTMKGHGVNGIAALRKLERKHGRLPKTLMAITPSGGLHYYFCWPDDPKILIRSRTILPGIDIRGHPGLVVAPPSIKPGVGAYRFLNWGTRTADAPAWLLQLVAEKKRPKRKHHADDSVDLQMVAAAVRAIPNDEAFLYSINGGGWEAWNAIGMAIYAASNGEAFDLFDEFSSCSPKYDAHNTVEKWERFAGCPPTQIGAGSLFYWATQADPKWRHNYEKMRWQTILRQVKQQITH
jgi:hypothetical protein